MAIGGLPIGRLGLTRSAGIPPQFFASFLSDSISASHPITFSGGANGTRVNSAGLIEAAVCPRIDYDPVTLASLGVWVEEQRTNSVRRSDASGAVPGTPGTLPTNWSEALGGLTRSVVGTGVENGIPYVDIRFTGTATGVPSEIRLEAPNQIAASVGQSWSQSWYCKLVAGSLTGITTLRNQTIERDAALVFLTGLSTSFTPNGPATPLSASRVIHSSAVVSATAAWVQPDFVLIQAASGTIDATFRIGGIQMELGAFPTSYIPTAGSAVTRTRDEVSVAGVPFNSWFVQGIGTVVVEYFSDRGFAGNAVLLSLSDLAATNRIQLVRTGPTQAQGVVTSGGSSIFGSSVANSLTQNQPGRFGAAFDGVNTFLAGNNQSLSYPSGAPPAGSAAPASGITGLYAGANSGFGTSFNGHIRRVLYWNTRLPNATLEALTA